MNESIGQLLKAKPAELDEGGVVSGISALDTPLLVPDTQYINYLQRNISIL